MSWIAISNGRGNLLTPRATDRALEPLLAEGTLLLECTVSPVGEDQVLISVERDGHWPSSLDIALKPDGTVRLRQTQGHRNWTADAKLDGLAEGEELRLTYAWSAPCRIAYICVEAPDVQQDVLVLVEDPFPMPLADVHGLMDGCRTGTADRSMSLLAVSDAFEPLGPVAGIGAQSLVQGDGTQIRAGDLTPGDRVLTKEYGLQPVLHVVKRRVPACGSYFPVRLCPPFFGLDSDLLLARDHRLLITGADTEYLFGSEEVLVQAQFLSRMGPRNRWRQAPVIDFVQIVFERHVCMSVCGAWVESHYIGDLKDDIRRHALSPLSRVTAQSLPRHDCTAKPMLKNYESALLVSALCA